MTSWNEDNFLEKLLAQARQQHGAARGSCPDAETLCAVLEGTAPAQLRQIVIEHLRHCPDCAALQNRLLNFEAGSSPEPEAVWKETRKRLDNWLESFLRSEAANLRPLQPTSAPSTSPRWESFWSFFNPRKLVWGLGVAALAVSIGDAILVLKLRREQPGHAQIAAKSAAPPSQAMNAQPIAPAPSVPAPSRGGEINVGRAQGVGTSHFRGNSAKTSEAHARPQFAGHPHVAAPLAGAQMSQESGPQAVAERAPSEAQTALAQKAGAPASQPAAPLNPSTQDHNPPVLNAQAAPAPEPPAPVRAPGPSASSKAVGVRPTGAVTSGRFAAASVRSSPTPQPKVAEGPAPILRLDPSAHLLVALSSAERLPDGSFEFRGTLLLPVAHAGPVPLDRGAEVVGAGQTRDGQTSLAVMEFIVQGVRYMLKEGSGAMKAQTPGTGGAVQFERSQVLEMWPESPLVYERAPATAALVRIQLGQTIPEVVTVLGQPERIVNLGSKQIYVYKQLRITFLDGKVSDVQ